VMTAVERRLLLERLIKALQHGVITVELVNWLPGQPYRRAAKERILESTLTTLVRDCEATDGVWLYWWLGGSRSARSSTWSTWSIGSVTWC
jgi:hypothetical protein